MANKRVFVAFAIEDRDEKVLFTGHSKNAKVPFEFVDMSAKEPWSEQWKTNCRTRIRGCNGFIALVSKNTKNAEGELWEIKCAKEEGIEMLGIYIKEATASDKPPILSGVVCKNWTWENVKEFIDNL